MIERAEHAELVTIEVSRDEVQDIVAAAAQGHSTRPTNGLAYIRPDMRGGFKIAFFVEAEDLL